MATVDQINENLNNELPDHERLVVEAMTGALVPKVTQVIDELKARDATSQQVAEVICGVMARSVVKMGVM
jgi:hypothetical protein